jgi:hypothetical protein
LPLLLLAEYRNFLIAVILIAVAIAVLYGQRLGQEEPKLRRLKRRRHPRGG